MGNFDKIAGYNKEKEQLQGLRELLLNLEAYKESGIRIPRGVLLYGAPGVGKTVMARSIRLPLRIVWQSLRCISRGCGSTKRST